MSYDATDDWHRPPLHGFAAAVRAAPGTDRRTDRRTRESRDTTVLTLNKLTTAYVMKRYSTHRRSTSFRRCCRDSRPVCHRRMNTKCSRSWRTEISRFHTQLYTHIGLQSGVSNTRPAGRSPRNYFVRPAAMSTNLKIFLIKTTCIIHFTRKNILFVLGSHLLTSTMLSRSRVSKLSVAYIYWILAFNCSENIKQCCVKQLHFVVRPAD